MTHLFCATVVAVLAATGEPCLVCRHPMPESGIVHRHRGRDVPLCSGTCEEKYHADPDRYFSSLQPRAALFNEPAEVPKTPGNGWLIVGVAALAGVCLGGVLSYVAVNRGRRGPQGIPPGLRKVPVTHAPASCPKCGAENHPSAASCGSCNATLDPTVASEVGRS